MADVKCNPTLLTLSFESKLRPRKEPGLKQDWTNLSFLPPVNFFRTPLLLSVCLSVCPGYAPQKSDHPLGSVQVAWLRTSGPSRIVHSSSYYLVFSHVGARSYEKLGKEEDKEDKEEEK